MDDMREKVSWDETPIDIKYDAFFSLMINQKLTKSV